MGLLSAYIPIDRRQVLTNGGYLPDKAKGTVLFADISGFTPLTATLSKELGPQRGAEELTHQLNRVFDGLILEVHRYGGCVISFGGDAITCWFNADDGLRATASALAMQNVMKTFTTITTPKGTPIEFGVKVAATAGTARRFLVGRKDIQLIEVLFGDVLDRVAIAEKLIGRGEVIVGPEIVVGEFQDDLSAHQVDIQEWRYTPKGEQFAVITDLKQPINPSPWPDIPDLDSQITQSWVIPPVADRLQRGGEQFLSELRTGVVLFLTFSGIEYESDPLAGQKLNDYTCWVQTVLTRYEGYMLQLNIGDKGSYLYAGFGAPVAHEDDPLRALSTAFELQNVPLELNFIKDIKIGISQGQMYAGAYGGDIRRTYGVMGNVVNIGARLMSYAHAGQILVTEKIVEGTDNLAIFESLGEVSLKGIPNPVPVFKVSGKQHQQTVSPLLALTRTPMVGRQKELAVLTQQLQALYKNSKACAIVEGEAGIGKSRLLIEVMDKAQKLNATPLFGSADAIEQSTPYYAWRPVFRQLFNLGDITDTETARQVVLTYLAETPHLLERVPLLDAILPLNFPENELTQHMTGEVRADNTRDLLIGILTEAQENLTHMLLVLEDAHWLDSASWALTLDVYQRLPQLLLIIGTRPISLPVPEEYQQLLTYNETQHLKLETLNSEDTLSLACHSLGVTELPPEIVTLIQEKAEGHPFFSEELVYALRDVGLIYIEDGVCHLSPETKDWQTLDFPDTIQGIITSRIDNLTPPQQLTLKVASVIGRVFGCPLLRDIHPVEADKNNLDPILNALDRLDIAKLEMGGLDQSYIFKHIITQEVAYSLLLFSQRRELHQAIAQWYEGRFSEDLEPYYGVLAHHWIKADVPAKAIDYLEKAGNQALHNFANEEAVEFFHQALKLDNATTKKVASTRRAHWELKLGEAYVNWSNYVEGRQHLEAGLALLGQPVPKNIIPLVIKLIRQILRQVVYRFWSQKFIGHLVKQRELLLVASRAYEKLAEVYYFSDETVPSLLAAFKTLNSAESAGPSPELARGYATLGALVGFVPLHDTAKAYLNRAAKEISKLDNLSASMFVSIASGYYYAGVGDWGKAVTQLTQVAEIAEQLGDRRRWGDAVSNLAGIYFLQGKFFQGIELAKKLYNFALHHNDLRYQVDGLLLQIYALLYLSKFEESLNLLEHVSSLIIGHPEIAIEQLSVEMKGLQAIVYLRIEDYQKAYNTAEEVLSLTIKSMPSKFGAFSGYVSVPEVYLNLWMINYTEDNFNKLVQTACKVLKSYTRVFPIGQPRLYLWRGVYEWLNGKYSKAEKSWEKSLNIAQNLEMLYDQGIIHYNIGLHLIDKEKKKYHLTKALTIFIELKTDYDIMRSQKELDKILNTDLIVL